MRDGWLGERHNNGTSGSTLGTRRTPECNEAVSSPSLATTTFVLPRSRSN